jgi:hypothetical protein
MYYSDRIPRADVDQRQLFHYSPRDVCADLGLTWLAAVGLHEAEWISFDPSKLGELDEGQDVELRFVGALAAAGCDNSMLGVLLRTLKRPYHYSHSVIYFDWSDGGQWCERPSAKDLVDEASVLWIEELCDDGDRELLEEIQARVSVALDELDAQNQDVPG